MKVKALGLSAVGIIACAILWQSQNSVKKQDIDKPVSISVSVSGSVQNRASRVEEKVEKMATTEPKTFVRFQELKDKVLLTSEEEAQRNKIASDPELLQYAKEALLDTSATEYEMKTEETRINAIDYLLTALRYADKDSRQQVTQTISDILTADNIRTEMSALLQKSLMGDKVELYRMMSQYYPRQAKAMLEAAKGTHNYRIFQFAMAVDRDIAKNQ